MGNEKLLFIGRWNFRLNHRAKHVATYLEKHFRHTDLVGFESFYSGTGPSNAPPWYKARRGASNILHRGIRTSLRGSVREIVIHDLYAPTTLHLVIDDLWRYFLLRQVLTPPYEVAVFDNPRDALLAWLLKRSGRVERLIYDDHDYNSGKEDGRFSKRVMEKREHLCVRQADGVISTNALLARLRKQQGAKHVVVIPNGVDVSLFTSARQKVPHPPTLIYMGKLSMMWGLDLVIKAMPKLLQVIPNVRLLIAGEGTAEVTLQALSHRLGVAKSVSFLGCLAYHSLPTALAEADVGIATSQPDNDFRRYATPLKLIEYMAAGLPVIASRVGQTEVMVQQADAGILIGHSVEEFVAASTILLNNKSLYDRYSQAAIAYAEGFDWNPLMERVYQYVLDINAGN
jgi:glycosyltransferase involved in cell wall biosynthesis